MELYSEIAKMMQEGEEEKVVELVKRCLDEGKSPQEIIQKGLIAAMDEIGEMFSEGTIFVPEMLMSARAMKAGLEILRPILSQTGAPPKGRVMLATVQGDVHDIGKNLVGMMLEGAGYEVFDLGVNVAADEILERANDLSPSVVGLSALLTTSMPAISSPVSGCSSVTTLSRTPVVVSPVFRLIPTPTAPWCRLALPCEARVGRRTIAAAG